MPKVFDFRTQLAQGKAGEDQLCALCPELGLHRPDGWGGSRPYDLVTGRGYTVEVKTDSYAHDETGNFFMEYETISVRDGEEDRKLGGMWRAEQDAVDLFVYFFPNPHPVAYWFDNIPATVLLLNEWVAKQRRWKLVVKNGGYRGEGYLLPRGAMHAVWERQEWA